VARCTKIINAGADDAKYMINLRQYAKFVVALGDKVAPTDVEEGMRVGASACDFGAACGAEAACDFGWRGCSEWELAAARI
jgi:putative N-acetylmannosamine-6-phosphate epimerase